MIKTKKLRRMGIFFIIFTLLLTFINTSAAVFASSVSLVNNTMEVSALICGDCNNDGNIDAIDFVLLKQYLIDQGHTYNRSMDLNVDNTVDSVDFAMYEAVYVGENKCASIHPI